MEPSSGPLRIGDWTFDPESHRLWRAGSADLRLEPRLARLLRRLVEARGRVVRREELLDEVWEGTVVGEEALTQAVSLLRRALGDGAGRQRYVQTIPKKGYRLAPDLFTPEADGPWREPTAAAAAQPAATAAPPRALLWRGYALGFTALLVGALAAALVWYAQARDARSPAPSSPDAVTALPGRESQPRLSPDGRRVAFVWNGPDRAVFDLYTIALGDAVPRRLTATPELELSPAWSPDGRRLAFARVGAETCEILVLTPATGRERRVSRCGVGSFPELDWAPSGDRLAVSDTSRPPGSYVLSLLDLHSGTRRPLTSPIEGLGDRSPAFSPDGRELAFVRTTVVSASRLLVIPAEGGTPRRLPTVGQGIAGAAWEASGRSLIFAADRAGELGLWRTWLDGGPPRWLGVPVGAPVRPSTARRDGVMVFEQQRFDSDLWSLEPGTGGPPRRWADSTRWDHQPSVSPDGSRVAFVSSRTGQPEVWVADADGGRPRRLTHLRSDRVLLPRWSPDGGRVLFASGKGDEVALYVAAVSGGEVERLSDPVNRSLAGAWTADGTGILFVSDRDGGWGVWRMDAGGGVPRPLLAVPAGALWAHPRGAGFYFSRIDEAGIWHLPAEGGEPVRVTRRLHPGDWANWTVTDAEVVFLDRTAAGGAVLHAVDVASGRERTVASLPMAEDDHGVALSPATGRVLFSRADREESDILIVAR